MKKFLQGVRSPAFVVSVVALMVALGGTSIASVPIAFIAKTIGLNKTQKKQVTSIADSQISKKAGKLKVSYAGTAGTAGSATVATSATNAVNATTATSATVAGTAVNSEELGGSAASAFEPSNIFFRSGLITATSGNTASLLTFGPFTLTLKCVAGTAGAVDGEIDATSTQANSDGYGTVMTTAGTSYTMVSVGSSTTADENDDNAADFLTPSGPQYLADLTVGENELGEAAGTCFADVLATTS